MQKTLGRKVIKTPSGVATKREGKPNPGKLLFKREMKFTPMPKGKKK
jgi:hypothetical protein